MQSPRKINYLSLAVAAVKAAYGDYTGIAVETIKRLPQIIGIILAVIFVVVILPILSLNAIFQNVDFKGVFPIQTSNQSSYSNDFGDARNNNGVNQGHEGIDIFASRGTPIVAVEDSKIRKIGWNGLGGWRILLESLDGKKLYYYAHLERYCENLKTYQDMTGQVYENLDVMVKTGEVLGYVGSSGSFSNSTPPGADTGTEPHLHFQIWIIETNKEVLINPYLVLKILEQNNQQGGIKND